MTILDIRGRRVFRSSGPAPITWDAKDGSGRVLESGVYLATIVKRDGGRTYQSFTIAK
ncbi:MAG: hypothetical protein M0D55_09650 [Elusimicrobiota bacterium]|nr:MAG: hypothetical protein M0D55_09650 [Elusimicrobiota bacterium]